MTKRLGLAFFALTVMVGCGGGADLPKGGSGGAPASQSGDPDANKKSDSGKSQSNKPQSDMKPL